MLSEPSILAQLASPLAWVAFAKVVLIDLVLAGDNAIVIGMAAAGLHAAQRSKAILIGIGAATVLRILFAFVAVEMLQIVGLSLAGGLLLLWVCAKMWRELRENDDDEEITGEDFDHDGTHVSHNRGKTLRQAAMQIIVADVSMSLDNVLAVAGAAREHPLVLVCGLILSVALMGVAASMVAKILGRYKWIAYVGLAIIFYVALDMIYHGGLEVLPFVKSQLGYA